MPPKIGRGSGNLEDLQRFITRLNLATFNIDVKYECLL